MADQNILIKFSADTQDAVQDINKVTGAIDGTDVATNDLNKSTQSLRAQLRGMQQDLAKMAVAGQQNTEQYKKLRNEAGLLQDSISDARREISQAGSDTRGLDKALRATTVLVGGFTALQGATALFGKQGEELQKTLIKINAAMSILQGLQAIQNELTQKDSILTAAATKAKNLYALAVGRGSLAMKAFRVALVATGIGALIVILGTVIANWDRLSATITKSFPAFAKVTEFFRNFQFYLVGTAKSAVSFFRGLGDAFGALFQGKFKKAVNEIREIPKEMKTAFSNGFATAKQAAAESKKELEDAGKVAGVTMGNAAADSFVETLAARLARLRKESNNGRTQPAQGGIGDLLFGGAFEEVVIGGGRGSGRGAEVLGDSTGNRDRRSSRQKDIEQEKAYIGYLVESLQFVTELTGMIASARSARISAEIADLERLRDAELQNAELTARQKEKIEERYQKQIAKLKTQQAIAQRRADITQAVINTALAVTQALGNPFRIALVAALGAAQIAIIARQPIPKFRKGGEVTGKRHESGGVHIEAEGGEYIMKREAVDKYGKDFMKKVNSLALPQSIAAPVLSPNVINMMGNKGIDHEKLGVTISRELAKQPKVMIQMDQNGFTKSIQEGVKTTYYANRKFRAS